MSMASRLLAVCIKVLFPEPVTPITAMKTSGMLSEAMTMTLEICRSLNFLIVYKVISDMVVVDGD